MQGVAVMVFIGFGFLMTFLHTYSWSAVGYNFLMSALAVQWTIIVQGFFRCAYTGNWGSINLDIFSLITGNFGAAALMISFGAVLGKTSATQLIVMTIFEMAFYSMSEGAVTHQLHGKSRPTPLPSLLSFAALVINLAFVSSVRLFLLFSRSYSH